MTVTAIVFEPEGVLFDTEALRARALQAALAAEGVVVAADAVARAHAGVPAATALRALAAAAPLDDTGRDLVLRRAADGVRAALDAALPVYDPVAARALETLAAVHPLAVVTRATRADAVRMLDQAQLAMIVRTVRSLDDVAPDDAPSVWADAVAHCGAARGVAVAPAPLLAAARRAGLATPYQPDPLTWLAAADGVQLDSLF